MKLGTRSVLYGVHQFAWHPVTVYMAWRHLYKSNPKWWETICIAVHDLGYIGCPDIDGDVGREHPRVGAELAATLVRKLYVWGQTLRQPVRACLDESFKVETFFGALNLSNKARRLCLGHSRSFAAKHGMKVSKLSRADKVSVIFDPDWFYLLRAKASMEIWEYTRNASVTIGYGTSPETWLHWYKNQVAEKHLHE